MNEVYNFFYDERNRKVSYNINEVGIRVGLSAYRNISRLKLLGFKYSEYNEYLCHDICSYIFSDNIMAMLSLDVNCVDGVCSLVIRLYDNSFGSTPFYVEIFHIYGFYGIYDFVSGMTNEIRLLIPPEMVDYILNLESERDFDGIMQAFDNLIGVAICKLAKEINTADFKFMRWES